MSLMYKRVSLAAIVFTIVGSISARATLPTVDFADTQIVQQTPVVSGSVLDASGLSVIGASVIEKGTNNGTITDIDGNFSLTLSSGKAEIEISYIGYKSQTVNYVPGQAIHVVLQEDVQTLQEVVVVGFGSQKKANLTGAVSQVKMADVLGDRPVTSVKNALQGTMPGLSISGGASPGESKAFSIRGNLSVNGGAPLVLIDNVEGDIDMLNPEDIESISILKDAASSAIYGARAASGVILVTTKKAKAGDKFSLNYNNNFGFQKSINQPEQAPLDSYLQAYQDAGFSDTYYANSISVAKWREYWNGYQANPSAYNIIGDGIYIGEDGKPYYLKDSNPYNDFLKSSFMQQHNISASGGTERLRYRIGAGMTREDGPLITTKDFFKRNNISSFIGADITKWYTQEVDFRFADSDRSMPQSVDTGIFNHNSMGFYPSGMMPGSVNVGYDDLPLNTPANIIKYQNPRKTGTGNTRIFLKSIFKPIKGLQLVGEYTYDRKDISSTYYANKWEMTSIELNSKPSIATDYLNENSTKYDYNAVNLYGTYNISFKEKHEITAMAGFNQERKQMKYSSMTAYDMVSPEAPSFGGSQGKLSAVNSYEDYAIRGGFYRLNYNYESKYLLEVNGRYDGSSKFPKKSRFGFFPSFSTAWNIARENWMEPASDWLGEMKLRASWGQIGNQNIANYQFYSTMEPLVGGAYNPTTGTYNPVYWLQNGEHVTYITAPGLISDAFTWEVVETLDFGIDMSLFRNRFNATFDWYQRKTKNMLVAGVQLPGVVGTTAPLQNTADMKTTGWELSLTWRDKIGDWNYNVGFNIYDHTSEITKFNNKDGVLKFNGNGTLASGCYYEGQKLGEIWGYKSDGYYTIDDFVDAKSWKLKDGVASISGKNVRPGDEKFKNLSDATGAVNEINNGLNKLDDSGDRTIIGNTTARYSFGINLGVGYKGISLSAILQGTAKRDYWIGGSSLFPFGGGTESYRPLYGNQTDYWQPVGDCGGMYTENDLEYWEAKNPNANLYRIYGMMNNSDSNSRVSDKYLQSAAYMRIKNITLSYTFPQHMLQKIYLTNLRVFASGENLGTFSSLPKGYDPERLSWGYPFYRTISFGLNVTL